MRKLFLLVTLFTLVASLPSAQAQFGIGLTTGGDLYQRYTNPKSSADSTAGRSAGNVLLNSGIGPKIWIGGKNFSLSLEAQVVWGSTAFDMNEYKGIGAVAFPILAHLNFKGHSGFGKSGAFRPGFSLGGGVQYNRTELYGTTKEFDYLERKLFPTYVGEVKIGGGSEGICAYLYGRYGVGYDFDVEDFNGANSLNVGIAMDINLSFLSNKKKKKNKKPYNEFEEEEAVEEGQIQQ